MNNPFDLILRGQKWVEAKLDQLGFTQEWAQHLKRMCLNQDSNSHPIA